MISENRGDYLKSGAGEIDKVAKRRRGKYSRVKSKHFVWLVRVTTMCKDQATGDEQERGQENKTNNDKVRCTFCCNGILRA